MTEVIRSLSSRAQAAIPTRKLAQISMLAFAFLFPFLTWREAAGCALLALLFNLVLLPRLALEPKSFPLGAHGASIEVINLRGAWTGDILYPVALLALILAFRTHLEIAAAAWALVAMGDGLAGAAGKAWPGKALPWNGAKTWPGFAAFVIAGSAGAYILTRWVAAGLPADKALGVAVATALVGAGVESLPIRLDDKISVPLVSGGFMFCALLVERSALASNWPFLGRRILLALAVNFVFALAALSLKTLTRSGAVAGFFLGVAVYLGYGYKSFSVLLAFFVLSSLATRLGYANKAARGIAERRGGLRSWREAMANSLAGAFCSILVIATHWEKVFLVGLVAAFAEAAGDTVSSEIGQWLSREARLITNLKLVPAGENGGVTAAGTLSGILAAGVVVATGRALGLLSAQGGAVALAAGIAGNTLDSFLGAALERRGLVTNGAVNFFSTSFASALAVAVAFHWRFS